MIFNNLYLFVFSILNFEAINIMFNIKKLMKYIKYITKLKCRPVLTRITRKELTKEFFQPTVIELDSNFGKKIK
jgi:hypothetical protein